MAPTNRSIDTTVANAWSEASTRRVEEFRALATRLADASVLNSSASRARCRELVSRIGQLLADEDEYQESRGLLEPDSSLEAKRRLAEALSGCIDAGKQAELARLYVMSEHRDRKSAGRRQ